MRVRRAWSLGTWLWFGAAACGPVNTGGDTGGGTGTGGAASTGGGSETGTPTTGGGETTAASGSSGGNSTGAPIDCVEIPVTLGGPLACEGGEELVRRGTCEQLAGFEACPDESVHRHTSVACEPPTMFAACTQPGDGFGCAADGDCDEFVVGVCAQFEGCFCRYPCMQDEDCGAGSACACAVDWGEGHAEAGEPFLVLSGCVRAGCRSDADCGGQRCGVAVDPCDIVEGFYCHTPGDECQGHHDCVLLGEGRNRCAYSIEMARWICDDFASCE